MQNQYVENFRGGKMTRNPFFNFARSFRAENPGKRQAEIIQIAARAWRSLPEDQKLFFYRNAMIFKRHQVLSKHSKTVE